METKFQTSFIPKKPINEEQKSGSGISLFLLVSIIVFLVALGLVAWVFIERNILINKIGIDKQTIESNKASFETNTIESMILLDSRIKVANTLLNNHVSISPVFNFLEEKTLKSVRFKTFHFTSAGTDGSGNSVIKISMSGQAKDFKTVALQAEEFGKTEYRNIIKSPVFSELNLTNDGSVSFTFSASIVPKFISYKQNLSDNQQ